MAADLEGSAVDAAWLTTRLRGAGVLREASVTSVEATPVGVGMLGDSIRFVVKYDGDERAPGSFVGKFASANPTSRQTGAGFGLYEREVGFYRHVADTVAIRSPKCVSIEHDPADGTFALLMEDLTPARSGNQLTGCGLADAERAMEQAAALHGPRWNDATLREHAFLDTSGARDFVVNVFPDCLAEFHRRYDGVLEPEYMAVCDRYGALLANAPVPQPANFTLTHGDFRLDNMLFDARDGEVPLAVLDWQSPSIGLGAVDVAYFLGMALSIEDRRAHERHLLDYYLEQLRGYGVSDYGYDDLYRDYRLTLLSGVSTAVFASASTKRTERGDAMFLAMARGGCAQAIDCDALALMG
ncbi:phosphotransferase [Sphingomonas mucosissima]|uniref:Phosphotransferase enzyme family protein n=1 Tax=Sphingomonas mucosissima TaxID=370959 RepID=A0A245ZFQ5_9SPHN|nr:phosphotransferase [Sphingomonas mucosissima]OWK28575.1 phosphotransferase enzyme family protein [Sphingomonas mucosissima]